MCNPMAAMAVMSIASSGAQMYQQNETAQATMDAEYDAAMANYDELYAQQEETDQAANLEKFERMRQLLRTQSTMRVGMGESGLTGATPLRLLQAEEAGADYDMSIIESNRQASARQTSREVKSTTSQAKSAASKAKASTGTLASNGLQIISSGVSGYNQGAQLKKALR